MPALSAQNVLTVEQTTPSGVFVPFNPAMVSTSLSTCNRLKFPFGEVAGRGSEKADYWP